MTYQHYEIESLSNTVDIVWINKANTGTNSMSNELLQELEHIIDTWPDGKAMIIRSKKASGFIAGADIEQFTHVKSALEATQLISYGQTVYQKLENLRSPTVAVIEGFCLGGGLELALACRYRIALDDPKTKLGFPEVNLGIHPGWGGTVRAPRLLGSRKALQMMATGRAMSARESKKIGLVNDVQPLQHLMKAALAYIEKKPAPFQPKAIERVIDFPMLRPLFARFFYRELEKKIHRAHYPAPFTVIDEWLESNPSQDGYKREAESIGRLMMTPTARNLVRVFFLQDKLKAQSKGVDFTPKHLHVVGAGVMGGDIACVAAMAGMRVTLQDDSMTQIGATLKRAQALFKKRLKQAHLVQKALDNIVPDKAGKGIRLADVIIEAIPERLELKQALFERLEREAKSDAVLATNTSTLPLNEIAKTMQQPARLVGVHFFNPVPLMPLIEIIKEENTDATMLAHAVKFARIIDKLPLIIKSSPGFLVNRILMPYLMEALQLIEEGVSPEALDRLVKKDGAMMGPIELADKVGLDVCLNAAESLIKHFGGSISPLLKAKVEKKELGAKTGKGFFEYKNGKRLPGSEMGIDMPHDALIRMQYRMLNEAVACMREGLVSETDYIDAGMIFGAGFPAFRGGPIQYAKELGVPKIVEVLTHLQAKSDRFKVDPGWQQL